jgi:hypothetical protein
LPLGTRALVASTALHESNVRRCLGSLERKHLIRRRGDGETATVEIGDEHESVDGRDYARPDEGEALRELAERSHAEPPREAPPSEAVTHIATMAGGDEPVRQLAAGLETSGALGVDLLGRLLAELGAAERTADGRVMSRQDRGRSKTWRPTSCEAGCERWRCWLPFRRRRNGALASPSPAARSRFETALGFFETILCRGVRAGHGVARAGGGA